MPDIIEIIIKKNGEVVPLNTISDETFRRIKEKEEFLADIEEYCRSYGIRTTTIPSFQTAELVEKNNKNYVVIPLPITNNLWVLNAYKWVNAFFEKFDKKYSLWVMCDMPELRKNPRNIWISIEKK